jgi:hypothetical protein
VPWAFGMPLWFLQIIPEFSPDDKDFLQLFSLPGKVSDFCFHSILILIGPRHSHGRCFFGRVLVGFLAPF